MRENFGSPGKPLLILLRELGLAMIFAGVEALNDNQLRRYNKGITTAQAMTAINILNESGIDFELGFIMFDPLVTPAEILENLRNLRTTGAWRRIGAQFSRMRLQIDSPGAGGLRYQKFLRDIDLDYATYDWDFAYPSSQNIYHIATEYWHKFDYSYWLGSNIYRTSMGLGPYANMLSRFLTGIRGLNLALLDNITRSVLRGDSTAARGHAQRASQSASRLTLQLCRALDRVPQHQHHPDTDHLRMVLNSTELPTPGARARQFQAWPASAARAHGVSDRSRLDEGSLAAGDCW